MAKLIKLTIIVFILTVVSVVLFVFLRDIAITMKGSEAPGERFLKEESFWERYGVSPEGLVLWVDQSDPRSYGDASNWYDLSGNNNHGS